MNDESVRRRIVSEYLKEKGITQKELARISGLNPKTIGRFLSGNKPTSGDTIIKIFMVISKDLAVDKNWEYVLSYEPLRRFIVRLYEDKELLRTLRG